MDLIGLEEREGIQVPLDIETPEDFSAWANNLDRLPYSPKVIEGNLNKISVDAEGRIESDLKTASRTFFKGHKREDVIKWISEAFSVKGR